MPENNGLYYPCIRRKRDDNEITRPVGDAMSHDDALRFLKIHYRMVWLNGDAKPQPVEMIDMLKAFEGR